MLRRDRWSTLAIAVTLALGIGATTATYAVFNAVLFRPTPGVHGESAVFTVLFQPPAKTATAYGNRSAVAALRQAATTVESLTHNSPASLAVATSPDASPTFQDTLFVSSQFFAVIGACARPGRLLTDAEADAGSANVAVVSEHFWKTQLGGTSYVVGRTLAVNGKPLEIVGVIADHRGWSWTSSRGVPAAIGNAVGLGLYWLSSRWLETRLFGVRPLDPMTVTLAVVVLISLSVAAALLPARRASRVDPVVALRAE